MFPFFLTKNQNKKCLQHKNVKYLVTVNKLYCLEMLTLYDVESIVYFYDTISIKVFKM